MISSGSSGLSSAGAGRVSPNSPRRNRTHGSIFVNLLEEKQVLEFLVAKLKEEGILDLAAFTLWDESIEGIRSMFTQEWGHTTNAHQGVRGGTAKFLTGGYHPGR